MTILPPGRIFYAAGALDTGFMREGITSKALSLGGIFTVREAGNICSGGLKLALRASPEFASLGDEPSVYLAWRLSIVREAGDAAPVG